MDECCLVFILKGGRVNYTYKEGALQKEDAATGIRAEYSKIQPASFDFHAESKQLSEILYAFPASQSDTLKNHMERRMITVEEPFAESGVSESTIKRLCDDASYRTIRNNVLAIFSLQIFMQPLEKPLIFKYNISCTVIFTEGVTNERH